MGVELVTTRGGSREESFLASPSISYTWVHDVLDGWIVWRKVQPHFISSNDMSRSDNCCELGAQTCCRREFGSEISWFVKWLLASVFGTSAF